MRSMIGLAKNQLPGLVLLTLIPAFLILSYCFHRLKNLNQQLTPEK